MSNEQMPTGFVSYGSAICPQCDAEIELTGEADAWEEQDDGSWKITGYSPPAGVCEPCGLLIADDLEALRVYDLRGQNVSDAIGDITTTRCQDATGFYWIASVRVGPKGRKGSVAVLQARFESEEDAVMEAQRYFEKHRRGEDEA